MYKSLTSLSPNLRTGFCEIILCIAGCSLVDTYAKEFAAYGTKEMYKQRARAGLITVNGKGMAQIMAMTHRFFLCDQSIFFLLGHAVFII
jgi:hypothetical protein